MIRYQLERREPIIPPCIVINGQLFYDELTGRIVIYLFPTSTSPYYNVLMYKRNAIFYSVLYNTSFFNRKIGEIVHNGFYKHFITFYYISKTKYSPVLYDLAKGTFSGTFVVPTNDICNAARIRYKVRTGFQGKAIIYCKRGGRFKATIYDLADVNQTLTSFKVFLTHGIVIPVESQPTVLSRDIYSSGVGPYIYIFAYRKDNNYQKVTYRIKQSSVLVNRVTGLWFNPRYCLLLLLSCPGPRGIELTEIYSPKDGLIRKGLGRMTFKETIAAFHPLNNHIDYNHILLNPDDGSLLQMIRSRNKTAEMTEYLTSVETYTKFI
jgi:hypothetical protein